MEGRGEIERIADDEVGVDGVPLMPLTAAFGKCVPFTRPSHQISAK